MQVKARMLFESSREDASEPIGRCQRRLEVMVREKALTSKRTYSSPSASPPPSMFIRGRFPASPERASEQYQSKLNRQSWTGLTLD